jgi:hypothetical protein
MLTGECVASAKDLFSDPTGGRTLSALMATLFWHMTTEEAAGLPSSELPRHLRTRPIEGLSAEEIRELLALGRDKRERQQADQRQP